MSARGREYGAPVVRLRDGIELVAPGGVFVADESALVVADLHVGYAPTLRSRGYSVPALRDDELIARVTSMLERTHAKRLVVAGDLVHGPAAIARLTDGDSAFDRFVRALGNCTLTIVPGNHDRRIEKALAGRGYEVERLVRLGPHAVHHGDDPDVVRRERVACRERGGRVMVGHLHPALVLDDGAGARKTVPSFVTAAGFACLPALSPLSRGGDVRSGALRAQLGELVGDDPMGVAAVVGERVMVIGDVFGG